MMYSIQALLVLYFVQLDNKFTSLDCAYRAVMRQKMRQFRLTKLATNEYLKQFENNHMLVKYGED